MLSLTAAAYSADFNWVGSDLDDFLEPPNWDQNKVPGSVDGKDDNFFLVTHADPQLVNLDGDVDLSTGRGLIEDTDLSSLTTLEHLSGTLDIGTLEIGRDGFGEYRLGPDASLNVGHLALGVNEGSTGRFSNDGGQINVTGNATLIVGDAGSGQFDQSSGTTNDTNLILGNQATGDGTVNLSGGDIVISGTTTIGKDGIGDFFQDGGTHSAGIVTIGANTDAIGTYELLSGDLTATQLFVGQGGADYGSSLNGLLRQSGGTITVSQMQIGGRDEGPNDPDNGNGNGRYELLDGIATSQVTIVGRTGQGHVLQTGGEFNAGILQLGSSGLVAIDNGSGFDFYSSGTYDLQDGILNTTSTTVGLAGIGTFNQSGVTEHNVDTDLVVGSLRTVEEPYSGQVNEGVYNLAGGILAVQGNSIIGAGNNDGINFPGAAGATGTFNQTGGDHTVTGDLLLAQLGTAGPGAGGTGSYHLSAGMLNVQGDLRLSESNGGGDATFVQDGGAVFASLGFYQDGSNGAGSSYTLNGGTLSSGGFGSMSDNSVFDHVGGTHTSAGLFIIGNSGGSDYDTVYNMTGATAEANFNELWVGGFGIGIMNQSDGTVNVTTRMTVGDGPNTDPSRRYGEYNLSGGTIDNTGSLIVGSGNGVDQDAGFPGQPGGLGSFEQTGGDHSIGGNLVLGQSGNVAGGTGTYTLSSGTLHVMTDTLIGGSGLPDGLQDGTGTFTQTGGTFTTDGAMTVGTGVGTGTYNLSSTDPINNPAVLNTFITYQNGPNSTFNQAGGTHNTAFLNIYGGEYNLSSGTIEVAGNMGVGHIFNSAAFNQTGGDVAVNDGTFGLYVGGNAVPATTGTYTLDDGTLTVAATTHVGSDGVGTFNQNGGTHTADRLLLGENAGGNGTYNLTGGILNDDAIVGDAGVGVVNTSGGTHNVTGDLILGNKVTGDGTYNVSGTGEVVVTGTTRVGREGSGALTVADDGRFTGTGFVTLGSAPGSVGGLVLTDSGALNIDYTGTGAQLLVGDQGTGSASQTGTSSVTTGSLRVGVQGGSTGTYTMDGGTLGVDDGSGVAGGMRIGLAGNGTFTQNGGAVNAAYVQIGGANFGQGGGGSGTYNLNGGQLVASGNVDINVDDNSFGILNVAGGALAAGNIFNNDQLNYSAGSLSANVSNSANFNVSGGAQRTLTGNLSNNAGGVLDTAAATPLLVTGVLTNAATGQIQAGANITVGADYNNLAAGNGNAFNHRANVTGAGLILAAGNVTQAITGAVIGGTTASPVLDFGNVRVGASVTRNYQIANTGTTGPDLRGAIQTSVNGGNITDVRLTGSGVTAGNFGPVGIGASSGNQAVNFNASSAGALTGQAVHIANNFDNVQDQTIEIAGAAFNAAVGNATPTPVVLANQRVGGSLSQQLTVANTADAGAFSEDLNASFGANTGGATNNGGSVDGLLAGSSNSAAMNVGVDTATAGAKSGTVTLNYQTAGTVNGVSNGLGTASAGSQEITITGDVYRLAEGSATPDPVNFGNVHLNAAVSQSLTVSNTAANDGFSEGLNVSFGATSGDATNNGGAVNVLAAGGTSASAMAVGIDTGSAGAKTGTVMVNYASDGTGTSGLAAIGAGSQAVEVSGAVYRLASAQINNAGGFSFGNVHVGDTVEHALSITNNVANDAYSEGLDASFGAVSDARILTSGSIGLLAAGGTNNASMVIGVNTSSAGSVNGTATVSFASNGSGTSGLGITALPSQDVSVSAGIVEGAVFRLANPVIQTAQPVDFGKVRINSAASQALSILNDVPNDGFSEKLNATAGVPTGAATVSGSFGLLAPQGVDNSNIVVGLNTSVAGVRSGAGTIGFASDGTGTSGLGITPLASQGVDVTGEVYRLADPTLNTPTVTLLARVGDAVPSANLSVTNNSPDQYTEALKVDIGPVSAGFSGSGAIAALAAQATDAASLSVSLASTATSQNINGTAELDFQSTGAGTTGEADVSVGSAFVSLAGKVYEKAVALVQQVVDFGIVHVGELVAALGVSVTNDAPGAALNDTLTGSIGGASGPFTTAGNLGTGLLAGVTDTSSLGVELDTSAAGIFAGTAAASLFSHNPDMADLALGSFQVDLMAQVNNYANADLAKTGGGGSFGGGGLEYFLDFGNVLLNSGPLVASLEVRNAVSGPADLLDGLFNILGTQDFAYNAFNDFFNLAGGAALGGLSVSFDPTSLGVFSDDIVLVSSGHNGSGYRAGLDEITLRVRANVVSDAGGTVPEPGSLALVAIALAAMRLARRRAAALH